MSILSLLNTWSLFWLKLVKSVEVFLKKAKYLYFLECEVRFQRDWRATSHTADTSFYLLNKIIMGTPIIMNAVCNLLFKIFSYKIRTRSNSIHHKNTSGHSHKLSLDYINYVKWKLPGKIPVGRLWANACSCKNRSPDKYGKVKNSV